MDYPRRMAAENLDTFGAATWNVYRKTSTTILAPILDQLLAEGVTVFLMQEAGGGDIRRMLRSRGLVTFLHPTQYRIAWHPARWVSRSSDAIRLAPAPFFGRGSSVPRWVDAARVILEERDTGRRVKTITYHTPPAVQRHGEPNPGVPARVAATRAAMATLAREAKDPTVDAYLFGGDDNVDERRGHGWAFMLRAATGLRLVQAPEATHRGGRKIDDFRVRRLKPLDGRVIAGGGDHAAHIRRFAWSPSIPVRLPADTIGA